MKQNKAKKIILVLLAVICAAVLVYSLYQGLIIYIPQKQEQHRFSELQQIAEQENKEEKDRTESSQGDNSRPQNESSATSAGEAEQQILMLSTCSYHTENGRFVVAAYRI